MSLKMGAKEKYKSRHVTKPTGAQRARGLDNSSTLGGYKPDL